MTDIILHIQYLLRKHSCVIMPRLGALIATERAAEVNEEWGVINAPIREICFNAAIVNNDGLLASSIARREQLSYEAACRRMESGIEEIKQHLDREGEIQLGSIGRLSRCADSRLCFDPAMKAERQAAALGFDTISLPTVDKKQQCIDTHAFDSRYYYLKISKFATKVAASIAIPFVAALSILLWTISLDDTQVNLDRIDYASVVPIPTEATTSTMTAPTAENSEVAQGPQGHIVVAVFSTESQVARYIQKHGNTPYKLQAYKYGKTYRVTVGPPQSRDELVHILRNSDFIVEFPGAWIWMQE